MCPGYEDGLDGAVSIGLPVLLKYGALERLKMGLVGWKGGSNNMFYKADLWFEISPFIGHPKLG